MPLCPRIHFFEINDQPWFPQYFRSKVQDCLTLFWTVRIPVVQPESPAQLVASTIVRELSTSITKYTFIDFCAGAGGPTPTIERLVNAKLASQSTTTGHQKKNEDQDNVSLDREEQKPRNEKKKKPPASDDAVAVDFILTDLHPHPQAWSLASQSSTHVRSIPQPIDASSAPSSVLASHLRPGTAPFRLYNLAFHHFDDPLAAAILRNTLDTADGFAIFELQNRTLGSLVTVLLLGPLLWILGPLYFWRDPGMLFFTYVVPVVPFVVVFDGVVSSLRTRSAGEILGLSNVVGNHDHEEDHCNRERRGGNEPEEEEEEEDTKKENKLKGWTFRNGSVTHTKPTGEMLWFIGLRDRDGNEK